jgi:hypothetical protein
VRSRGVAARVNTRTRFRRSFHFRDRRHGLRIYHPLRHPKPWLVKTFSIREADAGMA